MAMPSPQDTIRTGKDWLLKQLAHGAPCPLCGQHAKMYKRKINSGVAKALIQMWQIAGRDYVHLPSILPTQRGGDMVKLVYWGLIEEEAVVRPDGGRAAYWRVTDRGVAFITNQTTVEKYALIYNGVLRGFEGGPVTIKDALGTKFDYRDLMAGR